MPKRTGYAPGPPRWVDVMTGDVPGVTAFYTDLFGWDVEEQRDESGGHIYSIFTVDGAAVAGLGGPPPGRRPGADARHVGLRRRGDGGGDRPERRWIPHLAAVGAHRSMAVTATAASATPM